MNVDNAKPVPKSLHTVTAIVNVAKCFVGMGMSKQDALDGAIGTLGLSGRDDPYNLAEQALKQLAVIERKIS